MKKLLFPFIFFIINTVFCQTDFSNSWEDFFSYTIVKEFENVDDVIYALSDNAIFTYDVNTKEIKKISSVNGLSGETTSTFFYSKDFKKLVVTYENGLIEIVNNKGNITLSPDLQNFTRSGSKKINHITEFNDKILLSTPFAIIEYNLEREEFGDTYFIGENSSEVEINETLVFNNFIYAASKEGLFIANADNNLLVDSNNWNLLFESKNITNITNFNNDIYLTEGKNLYKLSNNSLEFIKSFAQDIEDIVTFENTISIVLQSSVIILNNSLETVSTFTNTNDFNFSLNTIIRKDDSIYLATNEYGILATPINTIQYQELHPDGPLSNQMFSLTINKNTLWTVYGGYNQAFVPTNNIGRFSRFNGLSWTNVEMNTSEMPFLGFVDIAVNPEDETNFYISSFAQTSNGNLFSGGGLLEYTNNQLTFFYNSQNSPLSDFQSSENLITTRVSGTVFDDLGNLWVTDALGNSKLKKLDTNKNWSNIDLSALQTQTNQETGIIRIDNNNTLWIATRFNGVYVYNENGNRKRAFKNDQNNGNLPSLAVRDIAIDKNNSVWIGTREGLVVYNNALNVFNDIFLNAQPVVIEVNGLGERLLGEQIINTIAVDGADNKWFGVDNGGVLYTNPSGRTTIATFTTENSPLPSNRILKIVVNKENGKVFFLTDKGLLAYDSGVVPFGTTLGEVYAYPNPVLKNHNTVTITGRNNTNLPEGTNVKIVDISGNLVFETNVVEGQELQGGKVVWNKKNLAGQKVASGVYLVLLSNRDASENSITKIAIIN